MIITIDNYISLFTLLVTSSLTIWSTIYAAKTAKKLSEAEKPTNHSETPQVGNKKLDEPKYKFGSLILSALVLIGLFLYSRYNLNWIVVVSISLCSISLTINIMAYNLHRTLYFVKNLMAFHNDLVGHVTDIADVVIKIADIGKNTSEEINKLKKSVKNKNRLK